MINKKVLSIGLVPILIVSFIASGNVNNKNARASEITHNYSTGYKAPKLKVTKSTEKPIVKSSTYPVSYDSREFGYTTSVKDQGSIGDCWAFATYATLDTYQKKSTNKDYDFSEINLAANNGQGTADDGGNMFYAISYFMKGKGPVLEWEDPYPNPANPNNINSDSSAPANYYVDDITLLADRASSYDNGSIKENVMKYGGVYTSLYLEGYDESILKDNKNLYVPKGKYSDSNHAVVIVGWDDNYSKDNFSTTPEGNGAFICKNSWGSDFGDKGYIYVSYYDAFVGTDLAVIPTLTKKTRYDKRNAYGDNYPSSYYNVSSGSSYAASTFTATEDQYVESVGVFTLSQDISYDLFLEEDYGTNGFSNILSKPIKSIKFHDAGFHTVKLDNPIKISSGKTYAVAFRSNDKRLFVDGDSTKYNDENKNFVSFDGQSWKSGFDSVFIVANTTKASQYPITSINLDKSSLNLGYKGKYKLTASINPQNADNKTIYWTSSDPSVATVDEDGNVVGMTDGTAVITASNVDGKVKAVSNVTVSNALTKLSYSEPQENTLVSGTLSWNYVFSDKLLPGPGYNNMYLSDSKGNKTSLNISINYNKLAITADTNNLHAGAINLEIPKDAFMDQGKGVMAEPIERTYYIGYKAGEKVNFKDPEFEKVIRTTINKPSGDIYSEDMAKINNLNISNTPVWNLSGIEYATNLKTLGISNTDLIDISPVSNLVSLNGLNLAMNNINDIRCLKTLNNLNMLSIKKENIKDFSSVRDIKKLKFLSINQQRISDISFLNNMTNLERLSLSENDISDITTVATLKKLYRIELDGNEIKDISPLLQLPNSSQYQSLYGSTSSRSIFLGSNLAFNSTDTTSAAIKTKLEANGFNVDTGYAAKGNLNIKTVDGSYYKNAYTYSIDRTDGITLTFNSDVHKSTNFDGIKLKDYYNEAYVAIDKVISGNKITIKILGTFHNGQPYVLMVPNDFVADNSNNSVEAEQISIKFLDYLKGDTNNDGKVDTVDLANVASHYSETLSNATDGWDLKKDWNRDGIIDIYDISMVAKHMQ